jgi:hypothetical protein
MWQSLEVIEKTHAKTSFVRLGWDETQESENNSGWRARMKSEGRNVFPVSCSDNFVVDFDCVALSCISD